MNEFDIIKNIFARKSISREDVILGIGDDCAIVEVSHDLQLLITTDTLVAGVHFPYSSFEESIKDSYDIGYKSLAVNLSDLAAMGATPTWITLALTLPEANQLWLKNFSQGLFDLADQHHVQLIGGDITRGPLSITIQAHGTVPKGQAITRNTAKPGDSIYVTHTLGDAALALLVLQNNIKLRDSCRDYLLSRLTRPLPRIEIGKKLLGFASSAIDISDGLVASLQHILEQSHVGAIVQVEDIPLSAALRESVSFEHGLQFALTGGDDYELCFTVSPNKESRIENATLIGKITENLGLALRFKDGRSYNGEIKSYQHFS